MNSWDDIKHFRSSVYFISEAAFNCCVGNEYPGNIYLFKVTSATIEKGVKCVQS